MLRGTSLKKRRTLSLSWRSGRLFFGDWSCEPAIVPTNGANEIIATTFFSFSRHFSWKSHVLEDDARTLLTLWITPLGKKMSKTTPLKAGLLVSCNLDERRLPRPWLRSDAPRRLVFVCRWGRWLARFDGESKELVSKNPQLVQNLVSLWRSAPQNLQGIFSPIIVTFIRRTKSSYFLKSIVQIDVALKAIS